MSNPPNRDPEQHCFNCGHRLGDHAALLDRCPRSQMFEPDHHYQNGFSDSCSFLAGVKSRLDHDPYPCLSIRQPWAWLIIAGHKPIENRDWVSRYRGPLLIHAAKGMTKNEYADTAAFAWRQGVTIPLPHELERGGIIGSVTMTDCVSKSSSPWFFGKHGFVFCDPRPLAFIPYRGALGIFQVPANLLHGVL